MEELEAQGKRYKIIYADPPWPVTFGARNGKEFGGWKAFSPGSKEYSKMTIDQIKSLPVQQISDKDCVLYLWVINKHIEKSYDVARSWGFNPSCLLTWVKKPMGLGLGGAFCQTTEHILYCRKGNLPTIKRSETCWFPFKRQNKHSQKPKEFRDVITSVHGDVPRVELFARQATPGWDIWGNELENSFEFKEWGKNERN
jgi:N6-adenosine-specific RNA methylase IME4